MTTTLADQFISQPDWWHSSTIDGAGAITTTGAKDAALTRAGAGIYDIELGSGGTNSDRRTVQVDTDVICAYSVVDTDNTHKRISFLNNAGVATDPTRMTIAVRRLA